LPEGEKIMQSFLHIIMLMTVVLLFFRTTNAQNPYQYTAINTTRHFREIRTIDSIYTLDTSFSQRFDLNIAVTIQSCVETPDSTVITSSMHLTGRKVIYAYAWNYSDTILRKQIDTQYVHMYTVKRDSIVNNTDSYDYLFSIAPASDTVDSIVEDYGSTGDSQHHVRRELATGNQALDSMCLVDAKTHEGFALSGGAWNDSLNRQWALHAGLLYYHYTMGKSNADYPYNGLPAGVSDEIVTTLIDCNGQQAGFTVCNFDSIMSAARVSTKPCPKTVRPVTVQGNTREIFDLLGRKATDAKLSASVYISNVPHKILNANKQVLNK
jgi:hypothetical protein